MCTVVKCERLLRFVCVVTCLLHAAVFVRAEVGYRCRGRQLNMCLGFRGSGLASCHHHRWPQRSLSLSSSLSFFISRAPSLRFHTVPLLSPCSPSTLTLPLLFFSNRHVFVKGHVFSRRGVFSSMFCNRGRPKVWASQ